MELRHLRYFVTVAEELHFGKAAARLRIAQPPLSRQIRDLEAEVGAALLERDTRSVSLTPAGRVMLKEAREVLARAAYAMEATRRAAAGAGGELRTGYLSGPGAAIIPGALAAFRANRAAVKLTAAESTSSAMAEALARGELDAAFVSEPAANGPFAGMRYEAVTRYPVLLGVAAAHPLASARSVNWRALVKENFLVYSRAVAPNYRDWMVALCREAGFDPRIAGEVGSATAMLTGVAAGDGIAFLLPTYACWAPPGVEFKPLSPAPPPEEFGLVIAPHAPKAAAEAWLTALRDTARAGETCADKAVAPSRKRRG